MKTITMNVYKFDELSDEAKEKAVEKLWDINVDHEWWDSIYYNAENIGCKISGFDIDRGSYVALSLEKDIEEVVRLILENHGEETDTFKLAATFQKGRAELVTKYSDGVNLEEVTEDNEYEYDNDADDMEEEFTRALGKEYLSMLRNEYEYLTGREAIIETIEANDYDFTEDGKIY
jgi:hypothetical protein